ncbi:MAG TPA: tetratricopeptide repeat protein [Candidatus Obscuribacterales bacterium]
MGQNSDSTGKAGVLRGRGNAYNAQGNINQAIQDYLQAVAIDEAEKNSSGIAEDKVGLAQIYESSGDFNKALQYYKEASEISPIEALTGLGNVYLSLGDIEKAIALHRQSLEKAQQQEDKEGEGTALSNLANALRQARQFAEAEQALRKAIEIWENLRIRLEDANKVSIFEKQARTYLLLQNVLIAQNKPNEALKIAKRGRARAFVELLARRIQGEEKQEQASIQSRTFQQIQQIAKAQKATLVQYSLMYSDRTATGTGKSNESKLFIWVVHPTGDTIFRSINLQSLNRPLIELVTDTRQAIG